MPKQSTMRALRQEEVEQTYMTHGRYDARKSEQRRAFLKEKQELKSKSSFKEERMNLSTFCAKIGI